MRPYKRGTKTTTRNRGSSVAQLTKFRRPTTQTTQQKKQPYIHRYSGSVNAHDVKCCDWTFENGWANPYVADGANFPGLNLDSTGQGLQSLMLQQGSGEFQRVGNKVLLKSLRIRFNIVQTGQQNLQRSFIRLMVIYDRSVNGGYPATSLILANISQAGNTSPFDWTANINSNQLERYVVLMDERYPVGPWVTATDGTVTPHTWGPDDARQYCIDRFIKLKNLEQVYSTSANPMTIAGIQLGALYIFGMGSESAATAPYYAYGSCRLRYYDN